MRNYLRKAEWTLALTMTLLAICMHLIFLGHAGGFWREEVGSIRLASRPGISAVWDYLFYDSFPAFWGLVLRGWIRLGLGSEFGLRMLGFFTGLFVLGSFWFNARRLRITFPFFSLLLLGFSPVILIWGDSMRAWGW